MDEIAIEAMKILLAANANKGRIEQVSVGYIASVAYAMQDAMICRTR